MKSKDLKREYIEFFKGKKHKEVPNKSLVPENDPTVLFTTAGMHPLVPYILGEKHPLGKRLVNIQRCLRTSDIGEVGDDVHLTFFEMLGNWSLNDYWKEDAINFTFEFLTKRVGLDKNKLAVSVFKGDKDAPKDTESERIWLNLGFSKNKIGLLGKEDNWWGPAGKTGPCGPDTEIFYWNSKSEVPNKFNVKDRRWIEIGNNVFMEYNKDKTGKFTKLKQRNVDFGGGYERLCVILEGKESVYETSLFEPIMEKIKSLSKSKFHNEKSIRKIADHIKASVFLVGDGAVPSNLEQGYVLRRLIRTAMRHGRILNILKENYVSDIAKIVVKIYSRDYPNLNKIDYSVFDAEEKKFKITLEKGLRRFEKLSEDKKISGEEAFLLFQSFGFPLEMTEELAKDKKVKVDVQGYYKELQKHQEKSRTATAGKFASGLADHSKEVTRLHTANHLLLAALMKVLGNAVRQRGSNITKERLRFDFSFDRKMTSEEIKKVEYMVNEKINENIDVVREEMSLNDAMKKGFQGEFGHKYGEKVSTYRIGEFSKELCSGPHVKNTKEIGRIKIVKEESSSQGVRRIKAVLD